MYCPTPEQVAAQVAARPPPLPPQRRLEGCWPDDLEALRDADQRQRPTRPSPQHVWIPLEYMWDGKEYPYGQDHWTPTPGRWEIPPQGVRWATAECHSGYPHAYHKGYWTH